MKTEKVSMEAFLLLLEGIGGDVVLSFISVE